MSSSTFTPNILTTPTYPGQNELNLVTNPAAATSASTGWTATGLSVSRDTTSNPLNPVVPTGFSLSSTANAQTFTSEALTVPATLQNRKLKIEFFYQYVSGTSFTVDVLDGNAVHYNLSTDVSGTTTLAQQTGKFVAYFDTNNTSTLQVRISSTGTGVTRITNFIVGPGIQPQGAVNEGPIAYTPTTDGFGTITSSVAYYTRRGSYIKVQGRFQTGTVNANSAFVSLPSGLTVDTSAILSNVIVGKWWRNQAGANARKTSGLATDYTVNASVLRFVNDDYATAVAPSTPLAGNAVAASSEVIWFDFELPIAQWAGSGTVQLAQNDVEYASNSYTTGDNNAGSTTSFAYGPAGSLIPNGAAGTAYNRTVQFSSSIQAGDRLTLEVDQGTGGARWVSADQIVPFFTQTTNSYGLYVGSTSANSAVVTFAAGGYQSGATFGANGAAWSVLSGSNWRWRVRKSSAGAAVGFGIVNSQSAGLLPVSNSNLDDGTATRLGLKQYMHGVTYNNGVTLSLTSAQAGFSVNKAVFIPYQMQDGTWRLKWNIRVNITSATLTALTMTLNGVVFNDSWACSGLWGANALGVRAFVNAGANTLTVESSSVTTSAAAHSGDVELTAKPTWAY